MHRIRKDVGLTDEDAFREFARRAAILSPQSSDEEIDEVLRDARHSFEALSDLDFARVVCLIYGYTGVFVQNPMFFISLLSDVLQLPDVFVGTTE